MNEEVKFDVSEQSVIYVSSGADYEELKNKPRIDGVTLTGNLPFTTWTESLSNTELANILNS